MVLENTDELNKEIELNELNEIDSNTVSEVEYGVGKDDDYIEIKVDSKEVDFEGNSKGDSFSSEESNNGATDKGHKNDKENDKKKSKPNDKPKDWRGRLNDSILKFLSCKHNLVFLLILGLAIAWRLKYFNIEGLWNDAAVHLWYAIKMLREPSFMFTQEFVFGDYVIPQTFTAIFYLFTKNVFIAGKLMALLYTVVGLILIYMLGTELRNKFTGLMAAILLGVNHLFFFYSTRPLGDAPLTVSVIFLIYSVVKFEKEKNVKWAIISGFSYLIAVLHKLQASLFVLSLIIYYLLFKRKKLFTDKPTFLSWIIPIGTMFFGHIIGLIFLNRNVLGRLFGLMDDFRGMPFGLEAAGMLQWIFSWYLIPFVILGVLFVIFYKEKKYYFLIVSGIYYWIYFEINVDNTQDRYMLPLLPIAIMLALFGISELAHYISMLTPPKIKNAKLIRQGFCMLLIFGTVLVIGNHYYETAEPLVVRGSFSYTGHPEAGEWLKQNVPDDAIVFAGSPRMVRAFFEEDYYKGGHEDQEIVGGPLYWLRQDRYLQHYYPDNPERAKQNFINDLEELIKEHDIYLEIDVWEYTQPEWYWPINQDSLNTFFDLGFDLVHVVQRGAPTDEGIIQRPVIFIFRRFRDVS